MSNEHTIGGFKIIAHPYLLSESEYPRRERTEKIVVHATHTQPADDIGVEELREADVEDGLLDVDSHFVIRRDGTIERGRPTWSKCGGFAIHVFLVGGQDPDSGSAEDNFSQVQKDALRFLILSLQKHVADVPVANCHPEACPPFNVTAWWADVEKPSDVVIAPQQFVGAYLH